MGLSVDLCYEGEDGMGGPDPYCGLKGEVPEHFECLVFYGTKYGTVRGCGPERQMNNNNGHTYMCPEKVRLYDSDGDFIGTANACPKETHEDCGADRCGMPVPEDWYCRTETYRHSGFYEGKVRRVIRCVGPLADEFFNNGVRDACRGKRKGYPIATAYDEKGRPIERFRCGYFGGSDGMLAAWASMEADEAEGSNDDQRGSPDGSEEGGASLAGGRIWPFGWLGSILGSRPNPPPNDRGPSSAQTGSSPAPGKMREEPVRESSLRDTSRAGFLRSAFTLLDAFGDDGPVSPASDTPQSAAESDTTQRIEPAADEMEGFSQAATRVAIRLSERASESVTIAPADPTDRASEPVLERASTLPEVSRGIEEPTRTSVVSSWMSEAALAVGVLIVCGGTVLAASSRRKNAAKRKYG